MAHLKSFATLSRFLLVDGLLTTVLLMLAMTFFVHLVFACLPNQVDRQYAVHGQTGTDPAVKTKPTEQLRHLMQREIHTMWLHHGAMETRVTRHLLGMHAQLDLKRLYEIQHARKNLEPLGSVASYGVWLTKVMAMDLGTTRAGQSLKEELREKVPVTFKLCTITYCLSLCIGIGLALIRTVQSHFISVRSLHYGLSIITALPAFVLGYLLIACFRLDLAATPSLFLPFLTLTFSSGLLNEVSGITHHALSEEMQRNYIKTAQVKGLKRNAVLPIPGSVTFHAFRQAAIHFLPRLAARAPMVLGMSLLVEKIFVLQGLGDMLIDGLAFREESRVLIVILLAVGIVRFCDMVTRLGHFLLNPFKSVI